MAATQKTQSATVYFSGLVHGKLHAEVGNFLAVFFTNGVGNLIIFE
jgi:hypothetical protein